MTIPNLRLAPIGWALVFFFIAATLSAQSVAPTPPSGGTNTVNFDVANKRFEFSYSGPDGALKYVYAPTTQGNLGTLSCTVGSYTFRPAPFAGPSLIAGSTELFQYSAGVAWDLLELTAANGAVDARWRMRSGATDAITYHYHFTMSGRTLSIGVNVESGIAGGMYLTRCEDAVSPVIVHVPYLTGMNLLYTNGSFCSLFFDWQKTQASVLRRADNVFSATSVNFAPDAVYAPDTAGHRQTVNETVYLTVSPSIDDVFPNLPNPVSGYRALSAQRIVFDEWLNPFATVRSEISALRAAGLRNLWAIVHQWQNAGYDVKYPDVLPANAGYGGDAGLLAVGDLLRSGGDLFSVHENCVDMYPDAASWTTARLALKSDGSAITSWLNPTTGVQSYALKPSLAAGLIDQYSPEIHRRYGTTAAYVDEISGNPPDFLAIDYDAKVANAGMWTETYRGYQAVADHLRSAHAGPVSGEGNHHFLYVGYFDDIEAQIGSGGFAATAKSQWLPMLLNFDLGKMHAKAAVHGVGYAPRFFSSAAGVDASQTKQPKAAMLEYIAAELAYGHSAFVNTSYWVYDQIDEAKLEQAYVYLAQQFYALAQPTSIVYHDSTKADEVSASAYIARYPTTFADHANDAFMSQVRVTYDNGTIVCVNRHPTRTWQVQLGDTSGTFDYNATINGANVQAVGKSATNTFTLPPAGGWVVYVPAALLSATPPSRSVAAGDPLTLAVAVDTGSTVQWQRNGADVANATSSVLAVASVQSADAGLYAVRFTGSGGGTVSAPAIVGVQTAGKVIGAGSQVGADIRHPNGNIFDQILLSGAAATITADSGKVTRTSFIDLNDDIVQVEFSGTGTLSFVLDAASGPAAPVNYNQPTVAYMKGHVGLVITGATETTNVSVFSVGRATAFDPTGGYNILVAPSATNDPAKNGSSLFQGHGSTAYDGFVDLAFIAISSANGKFGGIRCANARCFATKGLTGIYAPGVAFQGPVFINNISAFDAAAPVLQLGSAGDVRITGGDLAQDNGRAVEVSGITQLKFAAGSDSQGTLFAAKNNQARFDQNGTDVTPTIVVNPTP